MIEQKVKYKNDLKELITKLSIDYVVGEKLNLINQIKGQYDFVEYDQIVQNYADITQRSNLIVNVVKKIIDKIDNEIADIVNERYKDVDKSIDIQPTAHLVINEEVESLIFTRIKGYSQFKYPGLQLNCRYFYNNNEAQPNIPNRSSPLTWLNSMVANDPFYLAGPPDNLGGLGYLESMISPYPEIYQKRLRLYKIQDRNLDVLPQAQFGLILCWDFFNYQTLDTIEVYLSKIIKLLRPGGVLLFSYNNCNFVESARLFDNHHGSWATPESLEKIFLSLGVDVIGFKDIKTDVISYCSWVEVRRSGELTTVKLSQAQGLVQRK
jgi:SAM-dependent methyltransferase